MTGLRTKVEIQFFGVLVKVEPSALLSTIVSLVKAKVSLSFLVKVEPSELLSTIVSLVKAKVSLCFYFWFWLRVEPSELFPIDSIVKAKVILSSHFGFWLRLNIFYCFFNCCSIKIKISI